MRVRLGGLSTPVERVACASAGALSVPVSPRGKPAGRLRRPPPDAPSRDTVFPFENVALRNCAILRRLGYEVELRVDEGGIHWPSRAFQGAALDWFFALR